jgi:hypothetical protein
VKQCSLYVIATVIGGRMSAPIKVGIARAPKKRLADFQTASPYELRIALDVILWSREFAADTERACHEIAKAAGCHRRGEWLDLDPSEAVGLIGSAFDISCNSKLKSVAVYRFEVRRIATQWGRLREWAASYFADEQTETISA